MPQALLAVKNSPPLFRQMEDRTGTESGRKHYSGYVSFSDAAALHVRFREQGSVLVRPHYPPCGQVSLTDILF